MWCQLMDSIISVSPRIISSWEACSNDKSFLAVYNRILTIAALIQNDGSGKDSSACLLFYTSNFKLSNCLPWFLSDSVHVRIVILTIICRTRQKLLILLKLHRSFIKITIDHLISNIFHCQSVHCPTPNHLFLCCKQMKQPKCKYERLENMGCRRFIFH